MRVWIDITKPLARVRKIWSEGKAIGWAVLKYERMPNFCYWCRKVLHNDRDCELWLRSKGSLKKDEQQFNDWLRADVDQFYKKSSIVVPGHRLVAMRAKN